MRAIRIIALAVAAAASVSAQVELNGQIVPREQMIVYLFIGQSNMAGRAKSGRDKAPYTAEHERLWNFNIDDSWNGGPHHQWIPARAVLHTDRYGSGGYGPGMPFLKELAQRYPDHYFGIIQNAETQSTLEHYLNNGAPHNDRLYEQIIDAASQLEGSVTFGGVVTMLGIIERYDEDAVSNFAGNMKALADKVRDALNDPSIPFLVSQYEMGAYNSFDPDKGNVPELIDQIDAIPSILDHAAVIPADWSADSDRYMQDDHHYNLAGHVRWAQEAVALVERHNWVGGVEADTEAPSRPSNLAATGATINSIALSWSESSDNRGVETYVVYAGADSVGETASPHLTVENLVNCTQYSFTVEAHDYAGNVSAKSDPLQAGTDCSDDTQPPSIPNNLAATSTGMTSLSIAWDESSDNEGVARYEVFIDGELAGETAAASYTVENLEAATDYALTVRALDEAGNASEHTAPLRATTADLPYVAVPFRVNAGGDAVGEYRADKAWSDNGDYGYTGSPSMTAAEEPVANTDQDAVFQSMLYDNFGYRIRVRPGAYDVTLLFAEFWRGEAGLRVFSVDLGERRAAVDPIDVAAAAGEASAYRVTTRVSVQSDVLDITFDRQGVEGKTDPILSGIVIAPAAAYRITSPQPSETFQAGETMHIRWETDMSIVGDANIFISPDQGRNWLNIGFEDALNQESAYWEDVPWEVPARLEGVSLVGKQCLLKIQDYEGNNAVMLDGGFSVVDAASVGVRASAASAPTSLLLHGLGAAARFRVRTPGAYVFTVTSVDGRTVYHREGSGHALISISNEMIGPGVYLATLQAGAQRQSRAFMITR